VFLGTGVIFVNWKSLPSRLLFINVKFSIKLALLWQLIFASVVIELCFLAFVRLPLVLSAAIDGHASIVQAEPACCSTCSEVVVIFRNVKALKSIAYKWAYY